MKQTPRGFKMEESPNEPQEVKEVFEWYKTNFGSVPNLSKVLSAAPAALRAYWLSQKQLSEYGLLTPEEHNIVQMAIAVENRCKYCTSGHQMAGDVFFSSDKSDMDAIRNEKKLPDPKFEALKTFALEVYKNKGRIPDKVLEDFINEGYTKAQAIEVVANISVKVMSNFTNQLALTEIDEPFTTLAEGLFENHTI